MAKVIRIARKNLQVLNGVVCPVSVDVMNNFFWLQVSTQMLLHHQTVFSGVAVAVRLWMVWAVNQDISILVNHASTTP